MNFTDALQQLKQGEKITRPSYQKTFQHLELRDIKKNVLDKPTPTIYVISTAKGVKDVLPWGLPQADLLAEDWEIIA